MNTKEYKADYLKVSYWVDTPSYDHRNGKIHIRKPIYDITREQQREYLASKREEIEQDLLETFQTVRRNLYRILNNFWFDVSFPLGRKHGLDAMEDEVNNEAAKVISEMFNTLVASGKILQTEIRGNPAYRSLMKSDMPRERKKVIV